MPAIRPSTYTYTPGDYINSVPMFRGIIDYPNLLTKDRIRDQLYLRFDGLTNAETEEFFVEYALYGHGLLPFLLASEYLAGIDDVDLVAAITGSVTVPQWYYKEAPSITGTDVPGIHDVALNLERMIEIPWTRSVVVPG